MNNKDEHTEEPIWGRIARIAWAAWFSIMLATPYYLLNPYASGRLSAKYAYIAFGLVIGAALVYCLRSKLAKLPKPAKMAFAVLTAVAVVASLFFVFLEWCRMPVYLAEDAESGWWGPRYRLPSVFAFLPFQGNELMHVFCGAMCSISGVWAFARPSYDGTESRDAEYAKSGVRMDAGSAFLRFLPYLMFIGLLVAGFSLRAFFSGFFPYCDDNDDYVIKFVFSTYLVIVPYIFMFVLTAITESLMRKICNSRHANCGQSDPIALSSLLILAFSLGMLAWNGLCHAFPNYTTGLFDIEKLIIALGVCCVGVLVLEAVALFLPARTLKEDERQKSPRPSSADDGDEIEAQDFSKMVSVLPGGNLLTEREVDTLRLMAEGATSQDSADALGISASTVRQYLSRAYKKLGVANSDEFKSLVLSDKNGRDISEDASVDSVHIESNADAGKSDKDYVRHGGWGSLKRHVWNIPSLAGVMFIPIWCFMQKSFSLHLVNARSVMVCVAWAMVIWGVWRIFCTLRPSFSSGMVSGKWRRFLEIVGRGMFGISGVIAAIGIWLPDNSFFVLKSRPMLVVLLAVFIFTVGCLSSLSHVFRRLKSKNNNSLRIVLVSFAVIFVLFILASFNQMFSLAVGIAASILAITCSLSVEGYSEPNQADAKPTNNKQLFVLGCCAFAFIGFYSEEVAASPKYYDFGDSAVVFFIGLCMASMVYSLLMEKSIHERVLLAGIYVLVLVAGILLNQYLVTTLLLVILSGLLLKRYLPFNESAFPSCAICFGAGALIAFKSIREANASLSLNESILGNLSSDGFERLFEWEVLVAGAVLLAALAVIVVFYHLMLKDVRFVPLNLEAENQKTNDDDQRAVTYYLLSKRLTETQALVLYHVSRGESMSAIADDIGYSKGTVKSACHLGYRQLGIHSREQLVDLLNRELSL